MTDTSYSSEIAAAAAASGSSATRGFIERQSAQQLAESTDQARISRLAGRAIAALNDIIKEERLSYAEYNALKLWLIKVGEDGEWPLFLDVWVEHSVEEVASSHRQGSKGTIEGPYYVAGAPQVPFGGAIPMRPDEPGTPLTFQGRVTAVGGAPLANATIEYWTADALGFYSQFAPSIPEWNLRGTLSTDADGRFQVEAIQPAPYQIPTDGACGQLISAAGWHAWRPAHIHLKVAAAGHEPITTQLYFPGDPHNDDDIASAVKPELMLDPVDDGDGTRTATYDFVLDPA